MLITLRGNAFGFGTAFAEKYSQHALRYQGTYETNKEAVDQTDAKKRADLFRVHLLCRRGLMTQVARSEPSDQRQNCTEYMTRTRTSIGLPVLYESLIRLMSNRQNRPTHPNSRRS
jgi:hypothetical protein